MLLVPVAAVTAGYAVAYIAAERNLRYRTSVGVKSGDVQTTEDYQTAEISKLVGTVEKQGTDLNAKIEKVVDMVEKQGTDLNAKIEKQGTDLSAKIEKVVDMVEKQGTYLNAKIEKQGTYLNAKIEKQGTYLKAKIEKQGTYLNAKIEKQGADLSKDVQETRHTLQQQMDAKFTKMYDLLLQQSQQLGALQGKSGVEPGQSAAHDPAEQQDQS